MYSLYSEGDFEDGVLYNTLFVIQKLHCTLFIVYRMT